jgi:hypothetical protein
MILTKHVYASIKTILEGIGVEGWQGFAPQDAAYPYCYYNQVASTTKYDMQGNTYEDIRIQFSMFAKNQADVLDMGAAIEQAISHFTNSDDNNYILCVHKVLALGPNFNGRESYWQGILDFEFICELAV